MDQFMRKAIELAAENVRNGGSPFGAVLVKGNEIIAEGINELHLKYDVSAHAEMQAIRRAQENLQTNNLSGSIMYASGEPCLMCLTAIYLAGIEKVYYGATSEEAVQAGFERSKEIHHDIQKEKGERSLPLIHMPNNGEIEDPMQLWQNRTES